MSLIQFKRANYRRRTYNNDSIFDNRILVRNSQSRLSHVRSTILTVEREIDDA